MTKPTFLSAEELRILTGRVQKAKQIEALRRMGIQFFENANGHPVVPRTAIESRQDAAASGGKPKQAWEPNVEGIKRRPSRGRYEE